MAATAAGDRVQLLSSAIDTLLEPGPARLTDRPEKVRFSMHKRINAKGNGTRFDVAEDVFLVSPRQQGDIDEFVDEIIACGGSEEEARGYVASLLESA